MNEIKLTVELCQEDRARLDKLNTLLEAQITLTMYIIDRGIPKDKQAEQDDVQKALAEVVNAGKKTAPVEPPKNAQDAPKAVDHPTLDPFPETPTATEEPSEVIKEKEEPTVTMDMLRSKAITLAAAGKKEQVRAIVTAYAGKISDIPEQYYDEVYEKLCALEG